MQLAQGRGKKITASTEPEGVITCIIREESRNLHTKTHTTILR